MSDARSFPYRTALVTGGAGFIGGHIVAELLRVGCQPTVLDDLSSGSSVNLISGLRLFERDISDPRVTDLIEELAPELVIHAAAQVSVPLSMNHPARDRAVNLDGTRHVLEAAVRAGTKRVIFLSSGGAIYGSADGATENTLPAPESYYGIHKLAAEKYVAISGIPHGILRLANVYGPGQRAGLEGAAVAVFAERIRTHQPITVHGSGQQSRDFVHVEDVVRAVLTASSARSNGTWNVATGTGTTILDLLALVQQCFGPAVEVRHGPARSGDVDVSRLSVTKIEADLGWVPRYAVADGLRSLASDGLI